MLTVILVFLLSLIALPINSYAKGSDIIPNDKTGIPDKGLYQAILEGLNREKTGVFTKKEVAKLTFLSAGNFYKTRPDIKNLKGIENLKGLKGINVDYNKLKNLSGLEKLKKLEDISAEENNLTSIKAIKNLTKLKRLCIPVNQLKSISSVKNLTRLEELDISGNQLKSLSSVKKLTNLEVLYANDNALTSLSGVEKLVKLMSFRAYGNQLKSISGIEGLTNLESLDVSYNKIISLKGVENLLKLQILCVMDNKLRKLPDLRHLIDLHDESTSFIFNKLSKKELKEKLPTHLTSYSRWMKTEVQLQNATRKLKLTSPTSFKKIKSTTTKIAGTAQKNTKVRIRYKNKTIQTVKTNDKGVFRFTKLNLEEYKGKTLNMEVRHKYGLDTTYFTIKFVEFTVS